MVDVNSRRELDEDSAMNPERTFAASVIGNTVLVDRQPITLELRNALAAAAARNS